MAKYLLFTAIFLANLVYGAQPAPVELKYQVITQKSHDEQLFTQGYVQLGTDLIESSGLYNKSFIRRYRAQDGELVVQKDLPAEIFAEGLTLFNDNLYLLTWRRGILFILDPETLRVKQTKKYRGEGWGITHNNEALITSDGSSFLTFRDPKTFSKLHAVQVTENQQAINWLNELEFARGSVWANRWQSPLIYRIDGSTGAVTGKLDLSALIPQPHKQSRERVLNGIAYDASNDAFWITGKNWASRYLIRVSD